MNFRVFNAAYIWGINRGCRTFPERSGKVRETFWEPENNIIFP